jgi:peptidyl-dipeptidase Dcp
VKKPLQASALVLALAAAACSNDQNETPDTSAMEPTASEQMSEPASSEPNAEAAAMEAESATDSANPLMAADSGLPYGTPAFDKIESEHFGPAMEAAMAAHMEEVEAIANQEAEPTFENTIVAMERTGLQLQQVSRVFYALSSAHTSEVLQATQRELSPKLAAHRDAISLNPALFARVDALFEKRDELDLDAESLRLLEQYHIDFVRAGAQLDAAQQERMKAINSRLAELGTEFGQKVLAEVNDSAVRVADRDMLDGLSDAAIEAAANAAADRGFEGEYVITLLNTSGQPPLASLTNRDLRERIHTASLNRGSRGNDHDTRGIVSEIVKLRTERAQMLGYPTHAAFVLEQATAQNVEAVNEMLARIAPAAVRMAQNEAEAIQAMINETEEESFELASWDWAYYTEKVRQERFNFDESQLRPYFELNNVLENGVFFSAEKLFGITFKERTDLPVYHPSVRVWEVFNEDGEGMGLFYGDFYSRASKRGGAWMNSYQLNSGLLGGQPVVANHLNITPPPEGEPTLMTFDEVTTMFHEFGHAVHGLFSDVKYPRFAGTSVPRDFVEFPSQVYEMWATWPEVLENYALHYQTGERIPQELLDRVMATQTFNQGFATTEYITASIVDQALHQIDDVAAVPSADEMMGFEASAREQAGVNFGPVPPRYRIPYFSHSMGGYSAGYYSYIWSEVLDADSVLWFEENGGMTRENGQHFRDTLLSQGGSKAAMELYQDFAGREPGIDALLIRRGLMDDPGPGGEQ